jgi:hypothetical protein
MTPSSPTFHNFYKVVTWIGCRFRGTSLDKARSIFANCARHRSEMLLPGRTGGSVQRPRGCDGPAGFCVKGVCASGTDFARRASINLEHHQCLAQRRSRLTSACVTRGEAENRCGDSFVKPMGRFTGVCRRKCLRRFRIPTSSGRHLPPTIMSSVP